MCAKINIYFYVSLFFLKLYSHKARIKAEKFSINRNNNEISIAWKLQCNLFWRYFTNSLFIQHTTDIDVRSYICIELGAKKTNNVLVW